MKKRGKIILGILAALIVVAGGAFYTWGAATKFPLTFILHLFYGGHTEKSGLSFA